MGKNARVSNPYAPPAGDRPRPDQRPPDAPPPGHASGHVSEQAAAPRRPPDPAGVARASRQIMHFGLWMLGAILLSSLDLPWKVAALAPVAAAFVTGIRALITVIKARVRGSLVPMLVIGLVFSGLFSLTLLGTFATWPLQLKQQECLRGAVTISAEAGCRQDFQQGVLDWEQQLRQRSSGG